MTQYQKVEMLKTLIQDDANMPEDDALGVYLTVAENEIINWRFSMVPEGTDVPSVVPAEFEMTQIYAVLAGLTTSGAEGETAHAENGISRTFHYADMIDYIHAHVRPLCKVV
jgi:hypothetical protein